MSKICSDHAVTKLQNETNMELMTTRVSDVVCEFAWRLLSLNKWQLLGVKSFKKSFLLSFLLTLLSSKMGRSTFSEVCLENSVFGAWLKPVRNKFEACCTFCKATLKLGSLSVN